jgi:hypothetical protein
MGRIAPGRVSPFFIFYYLTDNKLNIHIIFLGFYVPTYTFII